MDSLVIGNAACRCQQFLALCKLRVVSLIVFTAVIGMFLAVPGWPGWNVLWAGTLGIGLVASAAALWLSYHGRERLLERYGPEGTVQVFRQLLRDTSRRPHGWATATNGDGILDVSALLLAPLPADHERRLASR